MAESNIPAAASGQTFDTEPSDPGTLTETAVAEPPRPEPSNRGLDRGTVVGRYVIVGQIGRGAMGVVYRAYDPDLDRKIALKFVSLRERSGSQEEVRLRLLREAQALARVTHPNVISVYDVGVFGDGVFLAMEYVEGKTLKAWMKKPHPWREVVQVFVQAGRGLAAAHAVDVVHRDFKPDNVILGRDGRVRVLDFGLARAITGVTESTLDTDDVPAFLERRAASFEASLTAHGAVVGTPAYMAPEQHLGKATGAASDQFSFCVALWEALYGERPFAGDTHAALAHVMIRGEMRTAPSDRGVPLRLQRVLQRGLQVRPHERFESMQAIVEALERDPAARWKRWGIASGAVGLTAGAVLATRWLLPTTETCDGADAKLDAVWNDARKTEIHEAFERSGYPFAEESWAGYTHRVEAFIDAWRTTYVEACEATRVIGDQSEALLDLRMECLDRGLGDLDAALSLFGGGERDAVLGALDAVPPPSGLAGCSDAEALRAAVPPPTDETRRATLERLRTSLAELRARVDAGLYVGAEARLGELEAEVRGLGHPPLTVKFLQLRATVQSQTGASKEARQNYEAAFAEALVGHDLRTATFVASKLAFVIGHRLAEFDTGRSWLSIGDTLLRAVQDDGTLQGSLWMAQGSLEHSAGNTDAAVAADRKAYDLWQRLAPRSLQHAATAGNLGQIMMEVGDYDQGVRLHAEELEITEAAYGRAHPETATARRRYGNALVIANRAPEAREQLEQSLADQREALGSDSMEVATTLEALGRMYRKLDQLDRAEVLHREALEIYRREFGPDHPDIAIAMMNVGYTAAAADRQSVALEQFQQATEMFERTVGSDHPQLLYGYMAIGRTHLELGNPAAAVEVLERGLAMRSASQVDPTLVAEIEFVLARSLDALGRPGAVDLARKALLAYRTRAKHWGKEIEEIEGWLAAHGAEPPPG